MADDAQIIGAVGVEVRGDRTPLNAVLAGVRKDIEDLERRQVTVRFAGAGGVGGGGPAGLNASAGGFGQRAVMPQSPQVGLRAMAGGMHSTVQMKPDTQTVQLKPEPQAKGKLQAEVGAVPVRVELKPEPQASQKLQAEVGRMPSVVVKAKIEPERRQQVLDYASRSTPRSMGGEGGSGFDPAKSNPFSVGGIGKIAGAVALVYAVNAAAKIGTAAASADMTARSRNRGEVDPVTRNDNIQANMKDAEASTLDAIASAVPVVGNFVRILADKSREAAVKLRESAAVSKQAQAVLDDATIAVASLGPGGAARAREVASAIADREANIQLQNPNLTREAKQAVRKGMEARQNAVTLFGLEDKGQADKAYDASMVGLENESYRLRATRLRNRGDFAGADAADKEGAVSLGRYQGSLESGRRAAAGLNDGAEYGARMEKEVTATELARLDVEREERAKSAALAIADSEANLAASRLRIMGRGVEAEMKLLDAGTQRRIAMAQSAEEKQAAIVAGQNARVMLQEQNAKRLGDARFDLRTRDSVAELKLQGGDTEAQQAAVAASRAKLVELNNTPAELRAETAAVAAKELKAVIADANRPNTRVYAQGFDPTRDLARPFESAENDQKKANELLEKAVTELEKIAAGGVLVMN